MTTPGTWGGRETRPRPLQTIVVARPGDDERDIVRRWRSEDARRCTLCDRCAARHADDGQAICVVGVSGPITPESAALFAARAPGLRIFGG